MKRLTLRTFMARHKDKDIRFVSPGPFASQLVVLSYKKPRTNVWAEILVAVPDWFAALTMANHAQGRFHKAAEVREVLGLSGER